MQEEPWRLVQEEKEGERVPREESVERGTLPDASKVKITGDEDHRRLGLESPEL
jgi:hypothetical protein